MTADGSVAVIGSSEVVSSMWMELTSTVAPVASVKAATAS